MKKTHKNILVLVLVGVILLLLWCLLARDTSLTQENTNVDQGGGEVTDDSLSTEGWQTYSGSFPSSGWNFSIKYPEGVEFSRVNDEIMSFTYSTQSGGLGREILMDGFLVTIRVEPLMTLDAYLRQINPTSSVDPVPFKQYDAVTYHTGTALNANQVTHVTFELWRSEGDVSVVDIAYSLAGEEYEEHQVVLFAMLETLTFW